MNFLKSNPIVFLAAVVLTTIPALAQKSPAAPGANAPANSSAAATSDKVDVGDIEKNYWASKDTDFNVVQNRTYSKAQRFSFSAALGTPLQDNYNSGLTYSFYGNYYFSERYGAQLEYTRSDFTPSDGVTDFQNASVNTNHVMPNHNSETNFYGASFNWVPIYAKMSLLGSKIIYFDMSFSPGVGVQEYNQIRDSVTGGDVGKSAVAGTFDVTQHYFFSNHFAVRFDYKNRWYSQEVIAYHGTSSTADSTKHTSILSLGLTYFF
jgi:outer membrane beta-barrel protein